MYESNRQNNVPEGKDFERFSLIPSTKPCLLIERSTFSLLPCSLFLNITAINFIALQADCLVSLWLRGNYTEVVDELYSLLHLF